MMLPNTRVVAKKKKKRNLQGKKGRGGGTLTPSTGVSRHTTSGSDRGDLTAATAPPVVVTGDVCWHTLSRFLSGPSKPFKRLPHISRQAGQRNTHKLDPRGGGGGLQDDIARCTRRWLRDVPSLDPSHPVLTFSKHQSPMTAQTARPNATGLYMIDQW